MFTTTTNTIGDSTPQSSFFLARGIWNRLTDRRFVQNYNNTNYTVDEFVAYIKENYSHLEEWYHAYNTDYRNPKSIDEFSIFLLNNLYKNPNDRPSYTIGNDEYGTYEPERFFLRNNNRKSYWYPVSETTGGRNYRRLHIYKSPYYTDQEFLPSQYTGHYRPYADGYFGRSSELTQNTNNSAYSVNDAPLDEPVHGRFNWTWYGGPTADVALITKYSKSVPSDIYLKIIYGKPISIFEYNILTQVIPNTENVTVFQSNINDSGWPLYRYTDKNYNSNFDA